MTASTTPQVAYGTIVTWNAHDIGHMMDIGYSGISLEPIDLSNHDSTSFFKEYGAGMLDGGELTISLRFIPGDTTGQKYFLADLKARTERQVIITLPDSTTWTFDALPTGFNDFVFNYEGSIDASIKMKVTGVPVFSEE